MPNSDTVFRKRWPFLAVAAVVLAVAVAAGSMFAANSGDQPVQEAAAAQAQPDLTDPGRHANPAGSQPTPSRNRRQPLVSRPLPVATVGEPYRRRMGKIPASTRLRQKAPTRWPVGWQNGPPTWVRSTPRTP